MNIQAQVQQILKIPVTRVSEGENTCKVYSTNDIYAGSIPSEAAGNATPQPGGPENGINNLHWETIYITNKEELEPMVRDLFSDKVYISLASFRHLHIRDADGENLALVECVYDGEWRVSVVAPAA